jgi:hypothetical protein
MQHPAGLIEIAERGVYWARYTKLGRPIAYAVDSGGDVIRRLVVQSDARADAAIEHLWTYLETVDNRHVLQLVRPILELPATERPAHLEVPDPYNLTLPGRWPRRA